MLIIGLLCLVVVYIDDARQSLPHHVFQLDVGMMVLQFLLCGLVVEFHGLMGAEMKAGEAHGALVPDLGLAVNNCDVFLGANLGADATADAFLGVGGWLCDFLCFGGNAGEVE